MCRSCGIISACRSGDIERVDDVCRLLEPSPALSRRGVEVAGALHVVRHVGRRPFCAAASWAAGAPACASYCADAPCSGQSRGRPEHGRSASVRVTGPLGQRGSRRTTV